MTLLTTVWVPDFSALPVLRRAMPPYLTTLPRPKPRAPSTTFSSWAFQKYFLVASLSQLGGAFWARSLHHFGSGASFFSTFVLNQKPKDWPRSKTILTGCKTLSTTFLPKFHTALNGL